MPSFCALLCGDCWPCVWTANQPSPIQPADAVKKADAKYLDRAGHRARRQREKDRGGRRRGRYRVRRRRRSRRADQGGARPTPKSKSEEGDETCTRRLSLCSPTARRSASLKAQHRLRRSAGQRADRRARSRQPASRSRRLVLYRRRALLLGHERDPHSSQDGSSWQTRRYRPVRRRPDAYATDLDGDGATSSRPATTPSSTPSAAMPARRRRCWCSPSRTAR